MNMNDLPEEALRTIEKMGITQQHCLAIMIFLINAHKLPHEQHYDVIATCMLYLNGVGKFDTIKAMVDFPIDKTELAITGLELANELDKIRRRLQNFILLLKDVK